jgi:hypothetical protein
MLRRQQLFCSANVNFRNKPTIIANFGRDFFHVQEKTRMKKIALKTIANKEFERLQFLMLIF